MHLIGEESKPQNIGIILPGQPAKPAEPAKLILPEAPEDRKVLDAAGEETSSMTWDKYLDFRPTTCKPRVTTIEAMYELYGTHDREHYEPIQDEYAEDIRREQIEEITQATLEFAGECAELALLVIDNGPKVLYGQFRDKLIDECGDILFTGSWAIDAWCLNPFPAEQECGDLDSARERAAAFSNPFRGMDDTELMRVNDDHILAQIAQAILAAGGHQMSRDRYFSQVVTTLLAKSAMNVATLGGLMANSCKKLRYQRREQDIHEQISRVCTAIANVNEILIMANSSIEAAMIANMTKLQARYPGGYKPGQGGGIRTEG